MNTKEIVKAATVHFQMKRESDPISPPFACLGLLIDHSVFQPHSGFSSGSVSAREKERGRHRSQVKVKDWTCSIHMVIGWWLTSYDSTLALWLAKCQKEVDIHLSMISIGHGLHQPLLLICLPFYVTAVQNVSGSFPYKAVREQGEASCTLQVTRL